MTSIFIIRKLKVNLFNLAKVFINMGLLGFLGFILSLGIFFIELNYRVSKINGVNGFYYAVANVLSFFILGLFAIGYIVLKDYFKKRKPKKPKTRGSRK